MKNHMKNHRGFGVTPLLAGITVAGLIAVSGWVIFQKQTTGQKDATTENSEPRVDQTAEARPVVADQFKDYELSQLGLIFKIPTDWSELQTYPNGVALKSSDYASAGGFESIKSGSTIGISDAPKVNQTLDDAMQAITMGAVSTKKNIRVAGYEAIQFTHSVGENRNNQVVTVFMKGDRQYNITQQYDINVASNPHLDVLENVLSSLKFKGDQ